MPVNTFSFLALLRRDEFSYKPQRRIANRPERGNRAKVKAARKQHRRTRG